MSEDANPFISGDEYTFSDDLIVKDYIFDNLVKPADELDEIACAFAQMAFTGLHAVLEKSMKEQLPGGNFYEPSNELRQETESVIPHNKVPERVFGILDFFVRYRPHASTVSNEAFLMLFFNKTSAWLERLPTEEKEKLLTERIKNGREIRAKYKTRLGEISNILKHKLIEKQMSLERRAKAALKTKSKHTSDIIYMYYGLWLKVDQIDTILDEIKGVTEKKNALVAQILFR